MWCWESGVHKSATPNVCPHAVHDCLVYAPCAIPIHELSRAAHFLNTLLNHEQCTHHTNTSGTGVELDAAPLYAPSPHLSLAPFYLCVTSVQCLAFCSISYLQDKNSLGIMKASYWVPSITFDLDLEFKLEQCC